MKFFVLAAGIFSLTISSAWSQDLGTVLGRGHSRSKGGKPAWNLRKTQFAVEDRSYSFTLICKGHDCFKNGWTVTYVKNDVEKVFKDVACNNQNCLRSGWISSYPYYDGLKHVVEPHCLSGGSDADSCFSFDEVELDGSQKILSRRLNCMRHSPKWYNCLNYGWSESDAYNIDTGDDAEGNYFANNGGIVNSSSGDTYIGKVECLSSGNASCIKDGFRLILNPAVIDPSDSPGLVLEEFTAAFNILP